MRFCCLPDDLNIEISIFIEWSKDMSSNRLKYTWKCAKIMYSLAADYMDLFCDES